VKIPLRFTYFLYESKLTLTDFNVNQDLTVSDLTVSEKCGEKCDLTVSDLKMNGN